MSKKIAAALGLSDKATESEILQKIAALNKSVGPGKKEMTDAELRKKADAVFAEKPEMKTLFMSGDGFAFGDESMAAQYARKDGLKVVKFSRENEDDLDDDDDDETQTENQ